jgi:hypothetical protein
MGAVMIGEHPSIKRLMAITKEYSVIIMIAAILTSRELQILSDSYDIKLSDKEMLSFLIK